MKSITLYYKEGGSDKVYQAAVQPKDQMFIVTFAFGRRGTILQTGLKTPTPVELTEAERIFDKLVREKTSKGYTPGESGTPYALTENAGAVSGILPQLLNSINEAQALVFAKSPLWCLQEKIDGRRLLIKKEGNEIQGINRRGLFCDLPSILFLEILDIEGDFIIDGEIVGEIFHAFDLLSCNGKSWKPEGYENRLIGLEVLLSDGPYENIRKTETFYGDHEKVNRMEDLRKSRAEGVVFKLLSAPYVAGRPASSGHALKYKFTASASFIVEAINAGRSVRLKLFGEKNSCGNVTIPPNHAFPEAGAVVEVEYLYAFRGGSLFQPVYRCERDDIEPEACLINQIKFKREEADDDGE